jgi:peroxiredoxin Q/BCP
MLEIGIKAPEFTLQNQDGKKVSLTDYLGKKVILYFYPKDDTPGCTSQACGFTQLYPDFKEKGAEIIGISKDTVKSHKKFADKYNLTFTLLADTETKVVEAYDVWKEKSMYGKKYMGNKSI